LAFCSPHGFSFTIFSDAEQVEYPDDFEDDDEKDDTDADSDSGPLQPQDDTQVEEFQLRDAGGLTVTLKALKEKG